MGDSLFVYLKQHQDVQEKVHKEVMDVVGGTRRSPALAEKAK